MVTRRHLFGVPPPPSDYYEVTRRASHEDMIREIMTVFEPQAFT